MYAITYNDRVILGPVEWNPTQIVGVFRNVLDINITVGYDDYQNVPYDIAPGIRARFASDDKPAINTKIQHYAGPTWNITDSHVIAEYSPADKDIDLVRAELKAQAAAERFRREELGTTTTIQGHEIAIDTARGIREVFVNAFLLTGESETRSWKFPDMWLTLNKTELGQIVGAGAAYVQSCFDWESAKCDEIDAAISLAALDVIEIVAPVVE